MKRILVIGLSASMATLHGRDTKGVDQLHSYFVANYKHFGKAWQEALAWYKRTLALGSPTFAHKGFIHYLHDTDNDSFIIKLKPVIEQHFKEDIEVQFILAKALAHCGHKQESDELFVILNNQRKAHQEIAFQVVQLYLNRQEPENALKVIDNLLNNAIRKPTHFIFHFLKSQIYLQLDKKDAALASIKASLDLHPRFDKGWLLRALLEEKAGNLEQAVKGYTNFLELVGPNQDIEQHLVALAFKQKIQEQTAQSTNTTTNLFQKSLQSFQAKHYKQALAEIETCIEQQPANNQAKILKVQIFAAMDEADKALQDLKTWTLAEPHQTIWYNTLHLLYRTGVDAPKIIRVLHAIEKGFPDQLLPSLYLADLYIREKSVHAATNYLQRCLKSVDHKDLQAALIFQLCALAYDNKQFKKVKEYQTQYHEIMQHHAPWLNLMAYYFTQHEKNHTQAQKLIAQARAIDPENVHMIDTQAFVFFNTKNYAQAVSLLEPIAQQEPHDYTIGKHLAKTYYELGKIEQAIQELNRVIASAPHEKKEKKYKQLLATWTKKE